MEEVETVVEDAAGMLVVEVVMTEKVDVPRDDEPPRRNVITQQIPHLI